MRQTFAIDRQKDYALYEDEKKKAHLQSHTADNHHYCLFLTEAADCTGARSNTISVASDPHRHSQKNIHGTFSGPREGSSSETADGLSAGNVSTIAN